MGSKRLRKTLPKDLPAQIALAAKSGDYRAVHEVLERCEVDARGGLGKGTALMMRECTPELVTWLIERGVDIDATNIWGRTALHESAGERGRPLSPRTLLALGADPNARSNEGLTPLHSAADGKHLEAVEVLLAAGVAVDATNRSGHTPLEYALRRVSNIELARMLPVAEALHEAGAAKSTHTHDFVLAAAERFEFSREKIAAEWVDACSEACAALCALFEVDPPGRRKRHDGTSPIVAEATRWQDAHAELWDLLVPASGACATVQGEVVRIAGRVSDELYRNGGGNWDADYRKMLQAFSRHVGSNRALPDADLETVRVALARLPKDETATRDLARLAVAWVALNPDPIALEPPSYTR